MEEIYWITRLDGIKFFLFILSVMAAATILAILITTDTDEDNKKRPKGLLSISGIIMIISIIAWLFTPSSRDMLLIYGVGGTVEYLKDNETAKQLPDKSIEALDKLLDEYLNENE